MSKIKDFVIKNKVLVSLVAVIFFMIILTINFLQDNDEQLSGNLNKPTTTLSKNDNKENEITQLLTEDTSKDEGRIEETTTEEVVDQETTIEETTKEQLTEQPIIEPSIPNLPKDYPYVLKLNRIGNCLTVYAKDSNGDYSVPVKAITVSCGKVIDDTPIGDFNTVEWYKWGMMFDGSYAQYAYRIVESILFHSVPYYTLSNGELDWSEYNKLGTSASHGCVRTTVADAKWIVENCPIGTKVIIYDDATNPGPLGKPDTIKIPSDSPYRGWDPTDPNPNNPWHQFCATLSYPISKSITVDQGCTENKLKSYFTAKDKCGNDISSKVKFSGKFDLGVPGTYKNVIASITDATGSCAEVTITIIVKANEIQTTQPTTTMQPTTDIPTTSEEATTTEATTSSQEETTVEEHEQETTSEFETETDAEAETSDRLEKNDK